MFINVPPTMLKISVGAKKYANPLLRVLVGEVLLVAIILVILTVAIKSLVAVVGRI